MTHRLTASRVALARLCLWWARPDVEIPASEAGAAAELGSALHEVAEVEGAAGDDLDEERLEDAFRLLVLGGAEEDAGAALPEAARSTLGELAAAWREWWAGAGLVAVDREAPLALSTISGAGRVLESEGQRDYSDAFDHEIPGTADLIAVRAAGRGPGQVVVEYKTGRGPHTVNRHRDQLLTLAAVWARGEGGRPGPGLLAIAVAWVTPEGVRYEEQPVDALELAIHVEELRRLLAELPAAEPRPGLHCEELYCPARAVCPATRAALVAAQVELEPRRRLPLVGPVRDNDQALAILVAAPLVEAWLAERVKAARAWADEHGGVRAPDGRIYKARPETRETPRLDVPGAEEALEGALGREAAQGAIVRTAKATWASIKAAARKAGLPLAETERRVRDALRRAHALKVSEYDKYGWQKE